MPDAPPTWEETEEVPKFEDTEPLLPPVARSPQDLAMQNYLQSGFRPAGESRPPGSPIIEPIQTGPEAGVPAKIGAGVFNTAAGVGNFLLSPEGIATAAVPGFLPARIAKPVLGLGFGGLMAKDTIDKTKKAINTRDAQDITEAVLSGAMAAGAGITGVQGVRDLIPKRLEFQGPIATGEVLRTPRGSPPVRRPAFQLPDASPKFEETTPVPPEPPPVAPKPPAMEAEVAPTPPAETGEGKPIGNRVGQFYEFIGDDALKASEIIGKPVEKRGGQPTLGIVFHEANKWADKLDFREPSKPTGSILDKMLWEVPFSELQGRFSREQHKESVTNALKEGKPVPPEVLADYPDLQPKAPPPPAAEAGKGEVKAAAKIQTEVAKVAATQGQRSAKEVKSELVSELEKKVAEATTSEGDVFTRFALRDQKWGPSVLVDASKAVKGDKPLDKWLDEPQAGSTKTQRESGKGITLMAEALEKGGVKKVTIDIPGDGTFTIWNTKEALNTILERAKKISTKKESPITIKRAGVSKEDKEWVEAQVAKGGEPIPAAPAPGTKEGMTGMGGAVPSEFEGNESFVSNMFAAIDRDRVAMGKPPMAKTRPRTWDEDNQRALSQMNRDPKWIPDLLDRMEKAPRPLLSWENAGVVWQRALWETEYNNALQRIARAFDDKREADLTAAKTDAAVFDDKLERLDRIVGHNGTGSEAGRSLQAQKMGAGDDFTLVQMTLQKRAAVGGRRLTPEETAAIQKDVDRLNVLNTALQKSLADADARASRAEADRAIAEMKAKNVPTFDKRVLAAAENIVVKMESRATDAAARLREKLARMSAGVDPTIIYDASIIGSAKIARLGLDLAKFTDEMVREFTEKIRPLIPEIWQKSNEMLEANLARVPEPVRRVIKKAKPVEVQQQVAAAVKADVDAGDMSKITGQVQKLARSFVMSGITDREALIDAVHQALQEIIPDLTRRKAMDMISGYGEFKRLTKDAISVQLRGMKGEMQQLAKLEDMAAGKPPLKTGLERRTPTDEERRLIKEVNDAKNKFQVPVEDPETQLKSALDTLKTTLANRIKDYEDRIARKDYAPRPRREVVLDAEATRLKAEAEAIKKRWREALVNDRLKNRNNWEKALDWGTKYRRAGVLSSPVVIPKLISAAAIRLPSMTAEQAIGAGLSRIPGLAEVAAKAPIEGGGLNLKAELAGYSSAFSQGMKDAYRVLKTGHTDLDVLYGKAGESYTGEFEMASRLLALPARLHGMLKAPVKRATFERAVQRQADFYARQGIDVTDPVVKARIAVDAYKAGNRSIFLNDNFIASKVSSWLAEHRAPGEEHPTFGSKLWSTTGRVLLPITRVPINIVAETMQYAGGLASGSIRLAFALRKGVETVKPEQADLIMRELKKGSIGAAVLMLGYFNADAIGGYYQAGKKQKPGEPKFGAIRVFGTDVPSFLLHNPLLETLQVGATVRRVADSHMTKKDAEPQGLGWGVYAAAMGMVDQVPFIREMAEIEKLKSPYTKRQAVGAQLESIAIPSVLQRAAEWTDPGVKRMPRNITESLKMGIPGLRQQVPVRVEKPAPLNLPRFNTVQP